MHNISDEENGRKFRGLEEIQRSMSNTEPGSHVIMVYPENRIFRNIYSDYIKNELESNNLVLMLPYYEHVRSVTDVLSNIGIDVEKHVSQGSLLITDAQEAFFGHRYESTEVLESPNGNGASNIVSLLRIAQSQAKKLQKDGITILVDLGCFFNNGGVEYLFKYEKSIPQIFKDTNLKQICLYHQQDFDSRLDNSDKALLLDQHGRSVLMLDNNLTHY